MFHSFDQRPDFAEMFVGVGASRVRDMFDQQSPRLASSSSMRSTLSAGTAVTGWAADTTSASKP
jgi:hypothetical protein